MSYLIKDYPSVDLVNWYSYPNGFSEEELARIEEIQARIPYQEAVLSEATQDLQTYRKSEIKWLNSVAGDVNWIFERFASMAVEANRAIWNFDLTGMFEDLQYTLYRAGGGHYDWHMDVGRGSGSVRKISVVVQLSDPEDYEGGVFELFINREVQQLPKKKGSVLLFPSYFMHRVTPVTAGERRSLVLWVSGPPFR